jgi:hypothetical protein
MKTILITQIYNPQNLEREKELAQVLRNNINNEDIDLIILIENPTPKNHDKYLDVKHQKIINRKLRTRPTYQDFFTILNNEKQDRFQDEDCVLIAANSDIYFHEDAIGQIKHIITADTALALSRWDHTRNGLRHHNRWDSQDVWIVKNKFLPGDYEITLGLPGCDNRIAAELQKAGYIVKNPSLDIKAVHFHYPRHNTYTGAETCVGDFVFIDPHHM